MRTLCLVLQVMDVSTFKQWVRCVLLSGLVFVGCTPSFPRSKDLVSSGVYHLRVEQVDHCLIDVQVSEQNGILLVKGRRTVLSRKCLSNSSPVCIEIRTPDGDIVSTRQASFKRQFHLRHSHPGTSFIAEFDRLPIQGSTIRVWQ